MLWGRSNFSIFDHLNAAILAARVRSNENIQGIKINNVELNLPQYADDTSAFPEGSKTYLEETF